MSRVRARINKDVLIWARQRLGLEQDEAARFLGRKPEQLASWEAGKTQPTVKQLYSIAEKLGQAPVVFYLPEPPEDEEFPHDFRRLAESEGRIDPSLAKEIRRAQRLSSDAADLLDDIGQEIKSFAIAESMNGDPESLGIKIRGLLGINFDIQKAWPSPAAARKGWSEAIEQQGALVLSAERIPLSVFRGVSLGGDGVPVVLLNGQDSDAGRVFTMMHELAHLTLHKMGICSVFDQRRSSHSDNARVEWFCNKVAAATLMPANEVLSQEPVARASRSTEWPDEVLRPLAKRFSVSQEAMLVRLVELERASGDYYDSRREDFNRAYEAYRKAQKAKPAPVPYKYRVLNKNGRAYTKLVLSALYDNVITTADVASLTGVNLKHMAAVEKELFGAPIVFGHGG